MEINYDAMKANAYAAQQQGPYANAASAVPQQKRSADDQIQNLAVKLQTVLGLTQRVESAAGRLGCGGANKLGAGSTGGETPAPDTLIWRLTALNKALDEIQDRLAGAVNAIESVI